MGQTPHDGKLELTYLGLSQTKGDEGYAKGIERQRRAGR